MRIFGASLLVVIVLLLVGYFIGVKFPGLGNKATSAVGA
jgi:hypothetical protein